MKFKSLTVALLTILPMFHAVADPANTNNVAAKADNMNCGIITLYNKPPKTKNIHFASINSIDGITVSSDSQVFTLATGKHLVKVIENIRENSLTRRRGEAKNFKFIEIDVQANKKYALGAKFIRKNRSKLSSGEYWEPVVWKENTEDCKLN